MTDHISIYETTVRQAIADLDKSSAPMIELHPIISYLNSECPKGFEDRRDSLIELARHCACKQRQRQLDAQRIGRMAG